jgi:hypothetical protein
MLDGRSEDVVSIAEACNRACEIAGVDHHVEDVAPSDDPELAAIFGPTLIAIASKAAEDQQIAGTTAESRTAKRLGYDPVSLDEGLRLTIGWLRDIGRLGQRTI